MDLSTTLTNAILSIVFAIIGFALLFVGYKVFDWLTPTNLADNIFVKGNVATAILAGAFVIGLAIIIGQAIS